MKRITITLITLLTLANASAQVGSNTTGSHLSHNPTSNIFSGDAGNGGGGVHQNGRYMTFYSYGFYTEREELTRKEVPQLSALLKFFNQFPYFSPRTKGDIAAKLIPTSKRKYYKVKKDRFTPEVRARLIEEFSRVTETNVENLALFAVTDTNNKITYFLPEFYKLSPVEQKAILFHEAFWLLYPKASVSQVIDAEISFQAYLENPNSSEKLFKWIEHAGSKTDKIQAAVRIDRERGHLKGLLSGDKLYLRDLLGEDMISCYESYIGSACKNFFQMNLYELREEYPQSLLLMLIEDHLVESKLKLYLDGREHEDKLFIGHEGWNKKCKKDYIKNGYINLPRKINLHDPNLKIHKKMSRSLLGKPNDVCVREASSYMYF